MECDQIINEIVSALATLVAAFAGAGFAFYLQDKKERRKEEVQRISSLNQALLALARQYQALGNIKNDIDPFREDKLRYASAPALSTNEFSDIKIKIETLGFLVDSSDPNLLMEIMLEQERFEMALKAVQLRSETHVTKFQPAYAKLGIDGGVIRIADFRLTLGALLADALKNETDQMYKQIYETYDSTLMVLNKLRAHAKQIYPKEKFLGIANPNSSSPASAD